MKRSSVCRVIVEVLVLGLLVVVYKIPYSSCMIYHVRTYSSPHCSHHSMYIRPVTICNGIHMFIKTFHKNFINKRKREFKYVSCELDRLNGFCLIYCKCGNNLTLRSFRLPSFLPSHRARSCFVKSWSYSSSRYTRRATTIPFALSSTGKIWTSSQGPSHPRCVLNYCLWANRYTAAVRGQLQTWHKEPLRTSCFGFQSSKDVNESQAVLLYQVLVSRPLQYLSRYMHSCIALLLIHGGLALTCCSRLPWNLTKTSPR